MVHWPLSLLEMVESLYERLIFISTSSLIKNCFNPSGWDQTFDFQIGKHLESEFSTLICFMLWTKSTIKLLYFFEYHPLLHWKSQK